MSSATDGMSQESPIRYRIPLAAGIGCYVLAVIVGMFPLSDDLGSGLLILLWIVHGVLLAVLISRLRVSIETALGAALFIVLASVMSVYVAGTARDDFTLQSRGERVTATVVKERLDPPQGRQARHSHYTLKQQDGTRVPGPEMDTISDLYNVGEVLTVIQDPQGKLRPETPGEADSTGDLVGAGAFALAALGAVAWMAWRGSDTAKRRNKEKKKSPSGTQKAYKAVSSSHTTQAEQEEKLRQALRTFPPDRRGYIKLQPESYPDVSQHRAARIAWEMGLRPEAVGNRGSWRFGETVMEAVPYD
ncbi:hypothetical protein AB0M87_07485 [Streptomyces sp. NPDC051320]|uniref:hypothetical protein n=1 Tax=Streptomyces sp. NPDC051320 TaxID=3154644 RepID=UPI00342D3825